MSERAFVAGATGYTGRAVVAELRERGFDVVAHVRPDSTQLEDWRARFEALGASVDSTPWQLEPMTETIARVAPRAVFALLGTTRARARVEAARTGALPTYETVDYGLTALLAQAVAASATEPRFVYLSSAGVSDGARGAYLQARAKVERELRDSSLDWVVARPSFITGSDRGESRPGERIGAALADAALGVVGVFGARKARDRYRSTTASELARGLVRIALDPDASRRVFESESLRDAPSG